MWAVTRPVEAVTEDISTQTVRPWCSVNCFQLRWIEILLLTYVYYWKNIITAQQEFTFSSSISCTLIDTTFCRKSAAANILCSANITQTINNKKLQKCSLYTFYTLFFTAEFVTFYYLGNLDYIGCFWTIRGIFVYLQYWPVFRWFMLLLQFVHYFMPIWAICTIYATFASYMLLNCQSQPVNATQHCIAYQQ